MNKNTFGKCVGMLQCLFGRMRHEDSFEIYWNRLKDISDNDFENAVSKIIDTFNPTSTEPFPSIARFVEAMGSRPDDLAIQAANAVKNATGRVGPYRSVSFGDRALHETIEHYGGWIEICKWHDREWGFNEKKFIETYKSFSGSDFGPVKLIGLSEIDYIDHGYNYLPERKETIEKKMIPVQWDWNGYKSLPGAKQKPVIEDKSDHTTQNEFNKKIKKLADRLRV